MNDTVKVLALLNMQICQVISLNLMYFYSAEHCVQNLSLVTGIQISYRHCQMSGYKFYLYESSCLLNIFYLTDKGEESHWKFSKKRRPDLLKRPSKLPDKGFLLNLKCWIHVFLAGYVCCQGEKSFECNCWWYQNIYKILWTISTSQCTRYWLEGSPDDYRQILHFTLS